MSTFLYSRPGDILSRTATVAVNTGTVDSAYPASYLVDGLPHRPGKLTTTTGSWTFQMASGAQRIDIAAIIHGNLSAGLEVRIQGHTSNAWGAPTLNQTFTIPAPFADSFPANPYVNLKALFPTAGDRTFEWWRLIVVGTNAAAISIGEVCLAQTRDLGVRNVLWGGGRALARPAIVNKTDLGVRHTNDFGTSLRELEISTLSTDAVSADLENLVRSAQGRTFLVVPHTDDNECLLVHTDTVVQHRRKTRNVNEFSRIFLTEASRGLYP